MDRLLITGASGFIGSRLAAELADRWDCLGTGNRSAAAPLERLDVSDLASIEALFRRFKPAAVIHTAAVSEPDRCEDDEAYAWRVNRDAPALLARLCLEAGARFIHVSSDLVFGGGKPLSREDDPPEPLSLYGRTKLESERAALAACPDTVVLRVSTVYGKARAGRPSFTDTLHAKLSRGETIGAFVDQWRSPTPVAQLPAIVQALLQRRDLRGVYHCTGAERVTRLEFSRAFAAAFGFDGALIRPMPAGELGLKAPRPRDCSLDSSKLFGALGMEPWTIAEGFERLKGEYPCRAS